MPATQRDTLRMFTALRSVRQTWAGCLLVSVGLNDAGRGLALASLAAGAAAIILEADATQIRAAQREGCCTFSVTSLDEALRIVKNEVRQRHAITVALSGNPVVWLQQMVERGVQPQAFVSCRVPAEAEKIAVAVLCERGMQTFRGLGLCAPPTDGIDLDAVLAQAVSNAWSLQEQEASSLTERRAQDEALIASITSRDDMSILARQWLGAAPALFPRALKRSYWRND